MYDTERVERLMEHYNAPQEYIIAYLDLREEGYNTYQAGLMSGIISPYEGEEE